MFVWHQTSKEVGKRGGEEAQETRVIVAHARDGAEPVHARTDDAWPASERRGVQTKLQQLFQKRLCIAQSA